MEGKRQNFSSLQFDDLPDEIVLKIFKKLDIKDLLNCGMVSKRIRAISKDESLWEKLNLCNKRVPSTNFLKLVLNSGMGFIS